MRRQGCQLAFQLMVIDEAWRLAERALSAALPRRWRHVQAVAERATEITAVPVVDSESLVAAAWLHDIGYAPERVESGFHPLDGARYLRRLGTMPDRVVCLVAHHSCAVIEAEERGLAGELLVEFIKEESPTADALWYADMTTGPDGERFDVAERLAEIRSRYGPDHGVTRFVNRAQGEIVTAVERTQARLVAVGEPTQYAGARSPRARVRGDASSRATVSYGPRA
jgi:HD domain